MDLHGQSYSRVSGFTFECVCLPFIIYVPIMVTGYAKSYQG